MESRPTTHVEARYNRTTSITHMYFHHDSYDVRQYSCVSEDVYPQTEFREHSVPNYQVPTEWEVLDTGDLKICRDVWIKNLKADRQTYPTEEEAERDANSVIQVRFGGGEPLVIRPGKDIRVEPTNHSTMEIRAPFGAKAHIVVLPG